MNNIKYQLFSILLYARSRITCFELKLSFVSFVCTPHLVIYNAKVIIDRLCFHIESIFE